MAVFSDPWTFMVLREAFFGVRRFDQFARNLDISRNVLTKRLNHLVEQKVFERRQYQSRPDRYEYRLTAQGLDMYPALTALMQWGDRWLADGAGPPLVLMHERCGHETHPVTVCDRCGEPVRAREMRYRPGPGAPLAHTPAPATAPSPATATRRPR